ERLIHRVGDPIVHRSAVQRMRMEDQRNWGAGVLRMMITALKPTVRAGKHHLWHGVPKPLSYSAEARLVGPPWPTATPSHKVCSPSPRADGCHDTLGTSYLFFSSA